MSSWQRGSACGTQPALKETVYWFVGSGVVLVAAAVDATPSWHYLKTILRNALGLTIIIAFVVNFYVLPLGYEMVLVFLVLVLTLGQAASGAAGVQSAPGRTFERVLTGIGLVLLLTFSVRAISDSGRLFTRESAEQFLVVPILTLALTPYLLAVAWYSRRELASLRRRIGLQV